MKTTLSKIHTTLTILFWFNIVAIALVLLFLLYIKGPNFGAGVEINVTLERYVIILTLAAIPLALKLFHNFQKKNKSTDEGQFLSQYKKWYILRIGILDVMVIVNLIGFYLYEANNFIYMTIVIIFAMMFCFPSKVSLQGVAEISVEEHIESSDAEMEEDNIENKNIKNEEL